MKTMFACFALSLAAAPGAAYSQTETAQQEAPRPAPSTLTAPKGVSQSVDARGFIHRWLVLEPVPVQGRLTETAVQEALKIAALPDTGDALPKETYAKLLANDKQLASLKPQIDALRKPAAK